MGLLSVGPSNTIRAFQGDGETVTLTVEDDRKIRIPKELLRQAANHGPMSRDAWETGLWDRVDFP
ncbi:MAG: hypothetical protein K9H25_02555 [Rhodospirillum sp.]|nr:hypothetical protein [Rhodospirillum sp.]MCF8488011.1 hypothetical protein [Rhodospirillum sp.]